MDGRSDTTRMTGRVRTAASNTIEIWRIVHMPVLTNLAIGLINAVTIINGATGRPPSRCQLV